SINSSFTPPGLLPEHVRNEHASNDESGPAARQARSVSRRVIRETGPVTATLPATPRHGRMANKSRLARGRQGVVRASFVTPNILWASVWIAGSEVPRHRIVRVPAQHILHDAE